MILSDKNALTVLFKRVVPFYQLLARYEHRNGVFFFEVKTFKIQTKVLADAKFALLTKEISK